MKDIFDDKGKNDTSEGNDALYGNDADSLGILTPQLQNNLTEGKESLGTIWWCWW